MCGIIGVVGLQGAPGLVTNRLKVLEYRGYDSWGIGWHDGLQERFKDIGPVDQNAIDSQPGTDWSSVAIGHTRWATHGGVTHTNAHPHWGCDKSKGVQVVHNGTLENHAELRASLLASGHVFEGETDTELIAHMMEDLPFENVVSRMKTLQNVLTGSYALAAMKAEGIVCMKKGTSLLVAHGRDFSILASDMVAMQGLVTEALPLVDGDIAVLRSGGYTLYPSDTQLRSHTEVPQTEAPELHEDHFMLQETMEIPAILEELKKQVATGVRITDRFTFVGSGSSHHAAMLGERYFKDVGMDASAYDASDTRFPHEPDTVIAISQSGETLDLLNWLDGKTCDYAITNHPESALGRKAMKTVPMEAGLEQSVAATKSFVATAATLLNMSLDARTNWRNLMQEAIESIQAINTNCLREMAHKLIGARTVFVLGDGLNYPIALEIALKLKEVAYIHAEAQVSGSLKHGPLALIGQDTPVIVLLSKHGNQNAVSELKARGANVMVLNPDAEIANPVKTPKDERIAPLALAVAGYLLSYYVANLMGRPIDRPRNLAKSVTVG